MSKDFIDWLNKVEPRRRRDLMLGLVKKADSRTKPKNMGDEEWNSIKNVVKHYRDANIIPPKSEMPEPSALQRLGRGFVDVGEGISDLTGVRLNRGSDGSDNLLSIMTPQEAEQYRKEAYEERDVYDKAVAGRGEVLGVDPYRLAGNILPYMATGAGLAGLATRYLPRLAPALAGETAAIAPQLSPATTGLIGSTVAGATGGATEGYLALPPEGESRGQQAIQGGLLGAVGGPAALLGGKAISKTGIPDFVADQYRKGRVFLNEIDAFRGLDRTIPRPTEGLIGSDRLKVDKFLDHKFPSHDPGRVVI